MSIWKRKPKIAPPVSRYVINVTYPDGGTFHLTIDGPHESDPPGHDPARIAAGIDYGLRRAGLSVEVSEELTVVRRR